LDDLKRQITAEAISEPEPEPAPEPVATPPQAAEAPDAQEPGPSRLDKLMQDMIPPQEKKQEKKPEKKSDELDPELNDIFGDM
jgi:hypothetical protein